MAEVAEELTGLTFRPPSSILPPVSKPGGIMKKLLILLCLSVVTAASAKTALPLKQVALFTSGVGYFERAAAVAGDDSAELSFTTEQISDVIKSIVLIDESGGSVSAVTYDSRDPVERRLKSFRVDLTDNPDRAGLFNRLRGVSVRVKISGQDWEGRIIGVESKKITRDDDVMTAETLNLLTAEGIKAAALDDIQAVEVLDAEMLGDVQKALELLATSHDRNKKGLRLSFTGKGQRNVRVGYMLETPIWKTSYRLVVKEPGLFLQGWAHVENTTDDDWDQVRLSLVSGRPISFIQDLYEPLYVKRPVVPVETYEGIVPPSYEAAMPEVAAAPAPMRARAAKRAMMMAEAEGGMAFADAAMEDFGAAEAQATTREAGELFEYAIKDPVTLPRQQSAMIPIVNEDIKGQPLSIYNRSVDPKFPLNGVEIDNTTTKHLMRGPVTVFEAGIYAGDGRLSDTRPGEKKFVSYAVDAATQITTEEDGAPTEVVSLKILRGILSVQRKHVSLTRYLVSSQRTKKRQIVIEHPAYPGWDLVEPKEIPERTGDLYRFRLWVEPQSTLKFQVKTQTIEEEAVLLSDIDSDTIAIFVKEKVVSAQVRQALQKLGALQAELAELRRQVQDRLTRVKGIVEDQNRIRENMKTVARNTDAYSRWERKLTQQEDELEKLNAEIEKLRADELAKRQEISAFLSGLSVE